MTAAEIMTNILAHGACAEGVAWAQGKDGKAFWSTSDAMAAPYLFWFAAKNADQSGWISSVQLRALLGQLIEISIKYSIAFRHSQQLFADPQSDSLDLFHWVIRHIPEANHAAYFAEILPLVKTLEPTV